MPQLYFFHDTLLPSADPSPYTHRHFSPKTVMYSGALLQGLQWACSKRDSSGWSWLDSGTHETTGFLSLGTNQSVWPTHYALAKMLGRECKEESRGKV